MSELTGQCLCGQISYKAGAPMMAAVCHCRHCQRQSGSAFAINVVVAQKSLELTGQTTILDDTGASGMPVARHFCGACGSPIMSVAQSAPGVVFLKGGTLDNADAVAPTMQIWTDCAVRWAKLANDLPGHAGNPAGR